jgi:hypothetical protein
MARPFRLYIKKRGDRRTGSEQLGSVGEAVFFAFFLGMGTVALIAILANVVIPEWRVNHEFVETTGAVLATRDGKKVEADGATYRPEVQLRYTVKGEPIEEWGYDITSSNTGDKASADETLRQFEVGREYVVWYDPEDPHKVVLLRGYTWWLWLVLLVPISFIAIGGAGLIYTLFHWGKSAERRSAAVRRVASLDLFDQLDETAKMYPYVPLGDSLMDSPGTTLSYRLPMSASPGWRLFAAAVACVSWNAVVLALLVAYFVGKGRAGPDWPFAVFVVFGVLAGLVLIYYFIRQLLLTTGVGPTLLEISDHPLVPGGQYQLFVSQTGKLTMDSLDVALVCDEEATYRQGTDTRTDRRRVYEDHLWSRKGFAIEQGLPFEVRCDLHLPLSAMHSFRAGYNEIQWKLVVRGEVQGWPSFERVFPIVVRPVVAAQPVA